MFTDQRKNNLLCPLWFAITLGTGQKPGCLFLLLEQPRMRQNEGTTCYWMTVFAPPRWLRLLFSEVIVMWPHTNYTIYEYYNTAAIQLNPLTPGAFYKKCVFWTFWWFLGWISAKLALIWPKMHLRHDSLPFLLLAWRFTTFRLRHTPKSKFWQKSDLPL